jgi:hypothetical protein
MAWMAKRRAESGLHGLVPVDIASVCLWGNHVVELSLKAFCKSRGERVRIDHKLNLPCQSCINACQKTQETRLEAVFQNFLDTDKFQVIDNFYELARCTHDKPDENMYDTMELKNMIRWKNQLKSLRYRQSSDIFCTHNSS